MEPQVEMTARCTDSTHRHRRSRQRENYRYLVLQTVNLDDVALRGDLDAFVETFKKDNRCPGAYGVMAAYGDIPQLQVRSRTTLIDDRDPDHLFIPVSTNIDDWYTTRRCSNCGWLSENGTATPDGNFHCSDMKCTEQIEIDLRAQHVSKGLCQYRNKDSYGMLDPYCPNPASGADSMCDDHRGQQCNECPRQAIAGRWEYSNWLVELKACERHATYWF